MRLHWGFKRWLRHDAKGGGWPADGERRCGVHLQELSKKACIAELEWEDERKQLLATIDSISLRLISNPIQLLILTIIALQLCSPRRRA
jgi:hypothetical protein